MDGNNVQNYYMLLIFVRVFTSILQQLFVDWSPLLAWSMYCHLLPTDYSHCYVTVCPFFRINCPVRSGHWAQTEWGPFPRYIKQ